MGIPCAGIIGDIFVESVLALAKIVVQFDLTSGQKIGSKASNLKSKKSVEEKYTKARVLSI